MTTSWHPLRGIDPASLRAARIHAHHATQWVARAARAYIPARPDDHHTNLGWDDAWGGLVTHPLPDGVRLGLRIADLTLALLDSSAGKPADSFALDGRRDADACEWLARHAHAHGLDPHALDAALPYPLPAPELAGGGAYMGAALAEPLAELATWFSNANGTLAAIRQWLAIRKIEAPPVRCWPHHFDLDTLVTLAPGRTTGIGFEPGDDHYDEPYFYVSLYPAPDMAALPLLPAIGHWHAKNFTAAIAPAHRILAVKQQGAEVAAFLQAAVEAAIVALR
ncbi:MAG TPA: DUF5996 family protein [Xanthobacteraceae bacterium]|jgi:hypothetical protein|nr:DUF5996 family protein [Xanthobacteraceae bacterium]